MLLKKNQKKNSDYKGSRKINRRREVIINWKNDMKDK